MLFKIQNFGKQVDIPVDGVPYFMAKYEAKNTDDERFAEEARKFPNIQVTELYEEMNYFELLRIAKQRGIEMGKRVKKNELVKILKRE